jgi:hypothetical protein
MVIELVRTLMDQIRVLDAEIRVRSRTDAEPAQHRLPGLLFGQLQMRYYSRLKRCLLQRANSEFRSRTLRSHLLARGGATL